MKSLQKSFSIMLPVFLLSALCLVSCKPDNQNEENNKSEENPPIEEYTPTMGLSDCLERASLKSVSVYKEIFCYEITEDRRLLVEHRLMELNCLLTVVTTSLEQHGDVLILREEECFEKDSIWTTCTCLKNVGYEAGTISTDTDSLLIQYHFSALQRGASTRTFKIPAQGSGSVVIRNLYYQ